MLTLPFVTLIKMLRLLDVMLRVTKALMYTTYVYHPALTHLPKRARLFRTPGYSGRQVTQDE